MSAERTAHYAALADDIQAFRHYIQAERGLAGEHPARLRPRPRPLLALGRRRRLGDYLAPTPSRPEPLPRAPARRGTGAAQRRPPPRRPEDVLPLPAPGRAHRPTAPSICSVRRPCGNASRRCSARKASNKLLDAPQPLDRFYLRDRAMLETLYATGSRASEVVGLKMADLYLDSAFCKCFGKGSKQRIVPLGRSAIDALRRYLEEQRPQLVQAAPDAPWVFVSRGGKRLTREMLWVLVKKYAQRAGLNDQGESAHAAAQLRHAPAGRRRRPAHRAGTARPRQHPHHADLHARRSRPAQGDSSQVSSARNMSDGCYSSPLLFTPASRSGLLLDRPVC